MRESRQPVLEGGFGFALNERQGVLDVFFADTFSAFGNPFEGEGFLGVGGKFERHKHVLAHILVGTVVALENNHLVRLARDSRTHRESAGVERFFDVGLGGEVRSSTLHKAEFDGPHLDVEAFLDYAAEDTR